MDALAICVAWGGQLLHRAVLSRGHRGFTLGAAEGVSFACGDVFGSERFELVAPGELKAVRVPVGAQGTWWSGDVAQSLSQAVAKGFATRDGNGVVLPLAPTDALRLELGDLTIEAMPARSPPCVPFAGWAHAELRMVNILCAVGVGCGLMLMLLATHASERFDETEAPPQVRELSRHIQVEPPAKPARPMARRENVGLKAQGRAAERVKRPDPLPQQQHNGREVAQKVGTLMRELLGGDVLSNDALARAVTGIRRGQVAADGLGGVGLMGDAGGRAPGQTIGLGAIERPGRGRGRRLEDPGLGGALVCRDCPPTVVGIASPPEVMVVGMDKELIREVIHRHRNEIRYCYELQLTRNPALHGKVAVRFAIGHDGSVPAASVAESNVGSPELERCVTSRVGQWQFPKPPGGGQVTVTYPFVFRAAGR